MSLEVTADDNDDSRGRDGDTDTCDTDGGGGDDGGDDDGDGDGGDGGGEMRVSRPLLMVLENTTNSIPDILNS